MAAAAAAAADTVVLPAPSLVPVSPVTAQLRRVSSTQARFKLQAQSAPFRDRDSRPCRFSVVLAAFAMPSRNALAFARDHHSPLVLVVEDAPQISIEMQLQPLEAAFNPNTSIEFDVVLLQTNGKEVVTTASGQPAPVRLYTNRESAARCQMPMDCPRDVHATQVCVLPLPRLIEVEPVHICLRPVDPAFARLLIQFEPMYLWSRHAAERLQLGPRLALSSPAGPRTPSAALPAPLAAPPAAVAAPATQSQARARSPGSFTHGQFNPALGASRGVASGSTATVASGSAAAAAFFNFSSSISVARKEAPSRAGAGAGAAAVVRVQRPVVEAMLESRGRTTAAASNCEVAATPGDSPALQSVSARERAAAVLTAPAPAAGRSSAEPGRALSSAPDPEPAGAAAPAAFKDGRYECGRCGGGFPSSVALYEHLVLCRPPGPASASAAAAAAGADAGSVSRSSSSSSAGPGREAGAGGPPRAAAAAAAPGVVGLTLDDGEERGGDGDAPGPPAAPGPAPPSPSTAAATAVHTAQAAASDGAGGRTHDREEASGCELSAAIPGAASGSALELGACSADAAGTSSGERPEQSGGASAVELEARETADRGVDSAESAAAAQPGTGEPGEPGEQPRQARFPASGGEGSSLASVTGEFDASSECAAGDAAAAPSAASAASPRALEPGPAAPSVDAGLPDGEGAGSSGGAPAALAAAPPPPSPALSFAIGPARGDGDLDEAGGSLRSPAADCVAAAAAPAALAQAAGSEREGPADGPVAAGGALEGPEELAAVAGGLAPGEAASEAGSPLVLVSESESESDEEQLGSPPGASEGAPAAPAPADWWLELGADPLSPS
eukprot:tig00000828_g4609.t1